MVSDITVDEHRTLWTRRETERKKQRESFQHEQ
jgi:hypothetical protein